MLFASVKAIESVAVAVQVKDSLGTAGIRGSGTNVPVPLVMADDPTKTKCRIQLKETQPGPPEQRQYVSVGLITASALSLTQTLLPLSCVPAPQVVGAGVSLPPHAATAMLKSVASSNLIGLMVET